jgi:hypothetical protein
MTVWAGQRNDCYQLVSQSSLESNFGYKIKNLKFISRDESDSVAFNCEVQFEPVNWENGKSYQSTFQFLIHRFMDAKSKGEANKIVHSDVSGQKQTAFKGTPFQAYWSRGYKPNEFIIQGLDRTNNFYIQFTAQNEKAGLALLKDIESSVNRTFEKNKNFMARADRAPERIIKPTLPTSLGRALAGQTWVQIGCAQSNGTQIKCATMEEAMDLAPKYSSGPKQVYEKMTDRQKKELNETLKKSKRIFRFSKDGINVQTEITGTRSDLFLSDKGICIEALNECYKLVKKGPRLLYCFSEQACEIFDQK